MSRPSSGQSPPPGHTLQVGRIDALQLSGSGSGTVWLDQLVVFSDIEPDLEAPVIAIADGDYALFYRDLSEEMQKYNGKTVKFKGILARDRSLGDRAALAGRHVMTCCEADISYHPLVCIFAEPTTLKTGDWAVLTGKIKVEKHKLYNGQGPVLYVEKTEFAAPAVPEVATFY